MRKILFRADASSEIGLGHIMRDLVLAQQYSNDLVIFATQNLPGNANGKILEAGYEVVSLATNNIDELVELIKKLQIDMLVFDHYGVDQFFEKEVKDKTKVEILSFDDTYAPHYCDILLNHNINAKAIKYKNLLPEGAIVRCGPKYTLIRDEFKRIKRKTRSIKDKKIKTVFVAMGGSDQQNVTLKILKVLSKFKNINVHIVTTSSNINLEQLKRFITYRKSFKLHIDSNQLAELMNISDFAIIAPSVISAEVIYMKLPFIAIKTAENQSEIYNFLKSKCFFVLEDFNSEKLEMLVKKMHVYKHYEKIKNKLKTIQLSEK